MSKRRSPLLKPSSHDDLLEKKSEINEADTRLPPIPINKVEKMEDALQLVDRLQSQSESEEAMFSRLIRTSHGSSKSSLRKSQESLPPSTPTTQSPNDTSLLTSMAARLTKVEVQLKSAQSEIMQKNSIIQKLERNITLLKSQTLQQNNQHNQEQWQALEEKCRQTQERLDSLEAQLSLQLSSQLSSLTVKDDLPVNVAELELAIQHLNQMISHARVTLDKTCAHTLKERVTLALVLYKNGFTIGNRGFRLYADAGTLFEDILDGFFPSELQARFPDGVPLTFYDKSQQLFENSSSFTGHGVNLQGERVWMPETSVINTEDRPKTSATSNKNTRIVDFEQMKEINARPATATTYLNQLPKTRIHAGKVIQVRNEVASLLGTVKEPYKNIECSVNENEKDYETCKLKITHDKTQRVFIISVPASYSVAQLLTKLEEIDPSLTGMQLLLGFPKTTVLHSDMTLFDAKCYPNANLHLLT